MSIAGSLKSKTVARKRDSAIPGAVGPRIDIEAIRQRSLAGTLGEMREAPRPMVKNDDGLGWARRILQRERDGERMPCISMEKARDALANYGKQREPGEEG